MPRITSFDFFRKLPKDLTYGTTTGGILSVMVLAILPALLFFECWAFITGEVMTDVVIDPNQEKMLQISFNVTMLELPCQFAEVDAFDFFGSKRLDIEKDIQKSSVTGTMGEKFLHYHYDIPRQEKHPDEMIPRTVVPDDFEIQNLTSANFESTLAVNPFSFVNFHAYWCHWCIIFDPTWKAFAAGLSTSGLPVKAYNIECEDQKELCSKHNIRGYPTLRMFYNKVPLQPDYNRDRTEEELRNYVNAVLRDHKREPVTRKVNPNAVAAVREHKEEGCNIAGTLLVRRVPGNVVLLANSREHNFDPKTTNTSHIVHHLYFGEKLTEKERKKIPASARHDMDPLENDLFLSEDTHTTHEHYLKLVSTFYRLAKFDASEVLGYRMTASNHFYNSEPSVPDVRFSYDMSPTAAVVTRGGRRWYEFLTNLCAITGGVFVVFKMTDGIIFNLRQLLKQQAGKQT